MGIARTLSQLFGGRVVRMRGEDQIPDDLDILDNGLDFVDGEDHLQTIWYHLRSREAGIERELWRVIRVKMLRYLPQEVRQESGLTDRMRLALVGLYTQRQAQYDLVELKAGVFDPPLGVMQMYGVVGIAGTRAEAARSSDLGMAALTGAMSNFPQARLVPLNVLLANWLRKALTDFPHALVAIGHPEERSGPRGMGREGPGDRLQQPAENEPTTEQQGEMVCRAMAAVQEEFLQLTIASRLSQRSMARLLAGVGEEAGIVAGLQTGSDSVNLAFAVPITLQNNLARNAAAAFGETEGRAVSDGVADTESESVVESEAETVGHATTDGYADTVGMAHTSGGSSSSSVTVTESEGTNQGTARTRGRAQTRGRAHTSGTAHSSSSFASTSVGGATTVSTPATTRSRPEAGNPPRTVSLQRPPTMESSGEAHSVNDPGALAAATAPPTTDMPGLEMGMQRNDAAHAVAAGDLSGSVSLGAPSESGQSNWNAGAQAGGGLFPGGISAGGGGGHGSSQPVGPGVVISNQATASSGQSGPSGSPSPQAMPRLAGEALGNNFGNVPEGMGVGYSESAGATINEPVTPAVAHMASWGASSGASSSTSRSSSTTQSASETASESDTVSEGQSQGRSVSHTRSTSSFSSTTHSQAHTESHSETNSWARTTGTARGRATGQSRTHGVSRSAGRSIGRSLGLSRGIGFGAAAVPSFGVGRAYQWWNDPAVQLTQLLRGQEELLRKAVREGAWQTDSYFLCRTERGAAVAETAGRQAYHGSGPNVVVPWTTRRLGRDERDYIRIHALTFTPSTREETVAEAIEAYKDSTVLLPAQVAAYMTPVAFEEGMAMTTQERIPAFAFDPDMPGEVHLAHQWSTERAELTDAVLKLSRKRHIHTLFSADTRFGKTVAAERLALETTLKWNFRTVVLDFGMGWRRLLNSRIPRHRIQIYQLQPNAAVPLQFNPWQVPERITAQALLTANCELFKNAGRMGPKQLGYMRRTAEAMYRDHGVLTADDQVLASTTWGTVRDGDEEQVINAARQAWNRRPETLVGRRLADLEAFERKALAVHRSQAQGVSMSAWIDRLQALHRELQKTDRYNAQSLEGALLRLEVFAQGEMARMYGPQRGQGVTIEDLGLFGQRQDQGGIVVIEGGAELDDYAKAALLGLISWRIYTDAVVRRRESIGGQAGPPIQIFFEEANKVLTGIEEDESKGPSTATSELYLKMWRDGAKYLILLHLIAQSINELPPALISSCANAFFGQMKNPQDRDLTMAHLGFSEKGFTDEDYKRFVSRMAQAMAVVKLGLSMNIMHTTPFLTRPIMVAGLEPTDVEILSHHLTMEARGWRPMPQPAAERQAAWGSEPDPDPGGVWVPPPGAEGVETGGGAWA